MAKQSLLKRHLTVASFTKHKQVHKIISFLFQLQPLSSILRWTLLFSAIVNLPSLAFSWAQDTILFMVKEVTPQPQIWGACAVKQYVITHYHFILKFLSIQNVSLQTGSTLSVRKNVCIAAYLLESRTEQILNSLCWFTSHNAIS